MIAHSPQPVAAIMAIPAFWIVMMVIIFSIIRRNQCRSARRAEARISGLMQPGAKPVTTGSGVASLPLIVAAIVAATYIAAATAAGVHQGNWVFLQANAFSNLRGFSNSVDQMRPIGDFTAIHITGNFKADLKLNAAPYFDIFADGKYANLVQASVADNVLTVSFKPGTEDLPDQPVHLHLRTRQIDTIQVGDSATIEVPNASCETLTAKAAAGSTIRASGRAKKLQASASAGSTVDLSDFTADSVTADATNGAMIRLKTDGSLTVTVSGGSNLSADGTASSVQGDVSTGSTLNLDHLSAVDVHVNAATASNVTVHASGSVTGSATTGSAVTIRGNPYNVSVDADISSSVHR